MNDPFEMCAPLDATTRANLNASFGILSLSEVPDNIVMWSHYAKSHSGLVLELDATHPFFDWRRHPHDRLRRIQPMRYAATPVIRMRFDENEWRRSNEDAERDRLEHLAGFYLLTKGSDWAYEREWRMIVPLARAAEVKPLKNGDAHLFAIPPLCIRGVITGSRMRDDQRKQIAAILDGRDYVHVELRRAEEDRRRFRVVVRDDESVLERRLLADVSGFPQDGVRQRIERLDVTSPRYYAAERALTSAGLISHQQTEKKKLLALTEAGWSSIDTRRKALAVLENAAKPAVRRYLENVGDGRIDAEEILACVRMDVEKNVQDAEDMDPNAIELFAALSDEDEDARWRAADSLRTIGDAPTVEHLIEILRADDVEFGDPPPVYFVLDHREAWGEADFRRVAAYALAGIVQRMAVPEAVEPLVDLLNDDDEDIRWQLLDALGHLGSPRALPRLREIATKDDADSTWGSVADAARTAIKRINARLRRQMGGFEK